MKTVLGIFGIVATAVVAIFAFSILLAFPVMWLYNATLPELFAFKPIGVWMAWKLSMLSALLFKSTSVSSK